VFPADRADTRGGSYGARSASKGSRVQSYARDARLSIRGTESELGTLGFGRARRSRSRSAKVFRVLKCVCNRGIIPRSPQVEY